MIEILVKVIATLAALLLIWLLRKSLVVAFSAAQARFGNGHNVSGHWTAKYTRHGTRQPEDAHLHQVLHKVSGTIRNDYLKRTYSVSGSLSANVLLATYDLVKDETAVGAAEYRKLDCGAFTLLIVPEGNEMHGRYCWMDSKTQAPDSGDYDWVRK